MTFYAHTRNLGTRPGVQLGTLQEVGGALGSNPSDQIIAVIGRFKRGRLDDAFRVNRGNYRSLLGTPEALRINPLNEAYVQLYEALDYGAAEAVVVRLSSAAAVNSFAVFNIAANVSSFSASVSAPATNYLFYFTHLACFNDGILIEVQAERTYAPDGVTQVAAKIITLRLREPSGALMFEFTGSLDPNAVDETGADFYLGAIIEAQTDLIRLTVAANATIPITADCYGRNSDGSPKIAKTNGPLILFTEGGFAYQNADYDRAIGVLENQPRDFGYLISGGTSAVALLSRCAQLANRANRQFLFDVPGNLNVSAAITFVSQLGLDSHYCQAYWAPLKTDDPVNGGKAIIGTAGINAGYRCGRNAQTNTAGLAPKHVPIAGKRWNVPRTGVMQLISPGDADLNDLANAKINPVLFEVYEDGGLFAFTDSLTCAKTALYRKLISTAEISSTLDDMIVRYGRGLSQMPLEQGMEEMSRFLKKLLKAARTAKWLVASIDLGDDGYVYSVTRNAARPADRMDVSYGFHPNGVTRAIFVTPTLYNN